MTTEVKNIRQSQLNLSLPVWTPGWYTIENYAKNILRFQITDAKGTRLPHRMIRKQTWQVDTKDTNSIKVEFDYRAPHAWVHLTAPDASGAMRRFSAEWANPRRLTGDGITRDKLKAGDRVIITGSPGRTAADYKIHLKQIRRPADGWEWGMRRGGARR